MPILAGDARWMASDNLNTNGVIQNIQYWLGQVAATGGQTFTADVVGTVPVTIQGASASQTGNLLNILQNSGGNNLFQISTVASATNGFTLAATATGGSPSVSATGADTNITLTLKPKGTGSVVLNGGGTTPGPGITVTGANTAVNGVIVTNAATGSFPTIAPGALAGSDTNINLIIQGKGTGIVELANNIAPPAAGSAAAAIGISSTANFGIYFGSGAPTVSAAQGSIYMRTDGSSTSTRMYVNTTGSTTWTNVTTAA